MSVCVLCGFKVLNTEKKRQDYSDGMSAAFTKKSPTKLQKMRQNLKKGEEVQPNERL